jgi:hypothetical protein
MNMLGHDYVSGDVEAVPWRDARGFARKHLGYGGA